MGSIGPLRQPRTGPWCRFNVSTAVRADSISLVLTCSEPTPLPTETPADPVADSTPKPTHKHKNHKAPETAIDILYENQRGGFLCGAPLFSGKALGNLDPPPWTNFAHKASPTDI